MCKSNENNSEGQSKKRQVGAGKGALKFQESSERTKRRKTENVRASNPTDLLVYATQMKLREEGKNDAAVVLKDVASGSPTKGKMYRKSLESMNQEMDDFTPNEALSLLLELDLSSNRYQRLRNSLLAKKVKVVPSYKRVVQAKKQCYPAEKIVVTDVSAEISLQALLHHTAERILQNQIDVLDRFSEDQLNKLVLICKWGCDGSSGHSTYKQKLPEAAISDGNIVFIALAPVQLHFKDNLTNRTIVIWKNPRPSSPRFCRPIKIANARETDEYIQKETSVIQEKIDKLVPYTTVLHRKKIDVNFELCLTMIDGKVCNALTETTSAQRCFLCGATSKQFNDLDFVLQKDITKDNYRFGLSSLHAWIRCFECLLHLSYKLDVKCWQVRKKSERTNKKGKVKTEEEKKKEEEEKKAVEEKLASIANSKAQVQRAFKSKLSLLVDMPKPGCGSSNDGNTARRFFQNYEESSLITGVDKNLIYRFYIILQTISSGFSINIEKFKEYALDTAKEFVKLYPWYYMPTTVHKLLVHGAEIIKHALLPIGQMSEEAQESCNKFFKKYRENFARKNHRQKTMEDVFKRFLISSDPIISSCRKLLHKPLKSLSPEVIALLESPSSGIDNSLKEDLQLSTDSEITSDESISVREADSDDEGFFF